MPEPARTLQLSHELPRPVVSQSQRERLIDAMIVATVERHYAHVTTGDVIRRAGVSRKTFYEHFAGKEECFIAAYDEIVRHLFGHATEAYSSSAPWRRRVAAGLQVILELLASREALARFCIIEILATGPSALARRDEVIKQFSLFFEPGREEAPAGVAVPELAPTATVGAIYSILYDELFQGRCAELPNRCPDLVHIALAPYIGPRAAAREAARVATAAA